MKQVWKLLGPNRALYLAALAVNLIFCGACVVCSTVSEIGRASCRERV